MGKIREEMEKVARENAIKDLKKLQIDIGSSPDDLEKSPLYYALDIAIKTLEQQESEDCISREAVEKITWEEPSYDDALNVLTEVRDKVRALPSVKPQPFINKPCVSEGVCREDKTQVLDKIRTEIIQMDFDFGNFYDHTDTIKEMVVEVIDKYKAESEE